MPWQKPIGIESDFTFAAAAADWIFKSLYDRGYWSVGRSILSRFSIPFQYMAGSNGFFLWRCAYNFIYSHAPTTAAAAAVGRQTYIEHALLRIVCELLSIKAIDAILQLLILAERFLIFQSRWWRHNKQTEVWTNDDTVRWDTQDRISSLSYRFPFEITGMKNDMLYNPCNNSR